MSCLTHSAADGAISYIFKGYCRDTKLKMWKSFVTRFTVYRNHFPEKSLNLPVKLAKSIGKPIMRLQLISGAVVLYTLAVLAWLCYVGISASPWHL